MSNENYLHNTPVLKRTRLSTDLTLTDKSKAYVEIKKGRRISDVARNIEKSISTIRDFFSRTKIKKTLEPQHKLKGRYRAGSTKLTDRQKELLRKWSSNMEVVSCQDAHRRLLRVRNTPKVAYCTVRLFLLSIGKWLLPKLKTILSNLNRKKRVDHCREYKAHNFKDVLYTDESCFQLNANTLKVFVLRGSAVPIKPKMNPNYTQMVWGGISYYGKTNLSFLEGWINAQKYQDMLKEQKDQIKQIFKKDRRHKIGLNSPPD